jgi:membrane associated rhomboid family serine protease
MGWQDREYARPNASHGVGGASFRPTFLAGRSIVTILIVINVAIYVLASFSPALGESVYGFGAMQTRAVLHGQVWRLITAQYLHGGTWHLFINMLVLHFLGRSLERMWSPRKFFTIYTLGGLAGNLFFTILGTQGVINPSTPAVGASGCIYALLGIVAVLFPTATVYIYFLFPIKIRTAAYIFGGISLFTIIKRGENFGGEACHLAGLIFGVWWAMKGDTWWSQRQLHRSHARPKARAAKPEGFKARVAGRRKDAETIDRILRKVYDGGIHSLSDSEKKALQEATERQRQREEKAGRVDQL